MESKSRDHDRAGQFAVAGDTGSVDCAVSPAVRSTSDSEVFSVHHRHVLGHTALTGISVSASRSLADLQRLALAREAELVDRFGFDRARDDQRGDRRDHRRATRSCRCASSPRAGTARSAARAWCRPGTRRARPARTIRAVRSDAASASPKTRWNKPPAIVPMKKVGPKSRPARRIRATRCWRKTSPQAIAASIPMPNSPAIARLITGYPSDRFCGSQIAITPTTASPACELQPYRQIRAGETMRRSR